MEKIRDLVALYTSPPVAAAVLAIDEKPQILALNRITPTFLNKVDRTVPVGLNVHVILENLSTHKTPTVQKGLLRHRRFHFHFTCIRTA